MWEIFVKVMAQPASTTPPATSTTPTLPNITAVIPPTSKFDLTGITGVVGGIIDFLLLIGGALLVIAIIYSGIMYITSGGDQSKAETAKKNLIWAITGLVVALLVYVIIALLNNILTTTAT